MTNRTKTILVMLGSAVVLIGWDLYMYLSPGNDTISEIITGAAHHPLVPFAFGFLMAHWFAPPRAKKLEAAARLALRELQYMSSYQALVAWKGIKKALGEGDMEKK